MRAAAVSSLRRGFLTKDSPTNLANIVLGVNRRGGTRQVRQIDDHFSPFHTRLQRDRIASTLLSDRRNVNRRTTIAADHVLAFLPEALGSANLAGVQSRDVIAIRFVNHEKEHERVV